MTPTKNKKDSDFSDGVISQTDLEFLNKKRKKPSIVKPLKLNRWQDHWQRTKADTKTTAADFGYFWSEHKVGRKVASLVLFVIVVLIIVGLGIYWGGWRNSALTKLVEKMRWPAAVVNGQLISVNEVLSQEQALTQSLRNSLNNSGLIAPSSPEEFTQAAFQKTVQNTVIQQLAKKYNLAATDADVAQYMNSLVSNFGSPVKIEQVLQQQYGWDLKTYVDQVVKINILGQKLNDYWETISPNKEAKQAIDQLVTELQLNPDKFQDLAAQYNQDATAAVKGEMGWLNYGDLLPELQKAVLTLKPGDISPVIVSSQGYHILKIGQTSLDVNGNQVWQAYQIFFKRYSFDQYLTEQIKKAQIFSLLKL